LPSSTPNLESILAFSISPVTGQPLLAIAVVRPDYVWQKAADTYAMTT
jgi:hypothetical protein